jgi:hypothetical protein
MPEGTRLLTRRIGGGGPGGSRSWRRRGSPSDTPLCPPSRSWPAAPPTPPPQPRGPPPRRPAPGSYRIPRILPPPGRRRVGGVRRGREQEKRRGAARARNGRSARREYGIWDVNNSPPASSQRSLPHVLSDLITQRNGRRGPEVSRLAGHAYI